MPAVVVVTDSTASLPVGEAERWGIEVVPLEVALGDVRHREGLDLRTEDLLVALTDGVPVSTSQPPPAAFAAAYARAAERGARAVVSVHLSGELSGTVRAAELAARDAPVPVHVVDSGTVAMGLGFAVLAAARAAAAPDGGTPAAGSPVGAPSADAVAARAARAAQEARRVAADSWVLFAVESLEHLRRGGRIGTAAAAVGGLLGMRPLLTVRDGRVEVAGTVRTARAARDRLLEAAVAEVASRRAGRVAVHHLGRADLGEALADSLRRRLWQAASAPRTKGADAVRPDVVVPDVVRSDVVPDVVRSDVVPDVVRSDVVPDVVVSDVSAVVGAHAGPGLLGVVVADG